MKYILIIISFLSSSLLVKAQDTVSLSLTQAIRQSISQSVDAVVARNEYKSSYWEFRSFKAELLPELTLNSTLPYYSKSFNSFQNPDGTYTFVENHFSQINAGLSVSQNIPLTGGTISVESSLERLQQHSDNPLTSYMAIPGAITLEQPIFGFNRLKWLKKIEPVKYKEAEQKLIADIEEVSNMAIENYFNLLLGKINLDIAQQNLTNIKKVYTVAEARRKIGQISENDLMQLHISLLKAEANLTDAEASLKARMFNLRSFLRYDENTVIVAELPEKLFDKSPMLNYSEVLSLARTNNPFTQNIQKRILEASREVSQAKADRWNAKLFVSFGVSGQQDTFSQAFSSSNWRDNRIVNVGIKVPLLDWGKAKSKIKIAEANREVMQSRIEKEELDFKQNIFLRVENFNNQAKQLQIAKEADEIAQKRYQTSIEAFILGQIDVLNLNDAQLSKDDTRRNYIEQMHLLWSYYYQIRSLTLYDFVKEKELSVNYNDYLN